MAATEINNLELPGVPALPKKRGRPATGKALTNAERQMRNRNWKKLEAEFEIDRIISAWAHLSDSDLLNILRGVVTTSLVSQVAEVYKEFGRRNGLL